MNYAAIKNCDIANGPGIRVSLFVSGCTHRCKGCFNQVAWDFDYGEPFTQETIDTVLSMLSAEHVSGLTLLGGEPFEPRNQVALLPFLRKVKALYPRKTIWVYSGYLFDSDILNRRLGPWDVTREILNLIDVLVDGPFVEEKKDLTLRFCGSSNQRVIDVQKSLKSDSLILWEDWQGGRSFLK